MFLVNKMFPEAQYSETLELLVRSLGILLFLPINSISQLSKCSKNFNLLIRNTKWNVLLTRDFAALTIPEEPTEIPKTTLETLTQPLDTYSFYFRLIRKFNSYFKVITVNAIKAIIKFLPEKFWDNYIELIGKHAVENLDSLTVSILTKDTILTVEVFLESFDSLQFFKDKNGKMVSIELIEKYSRFNEFIWHNKTIEITSITNYEDEVCTKITTYDKHTLSKKLLRQEIDLFEIGKTPLVVFNATKAYTLTYNIEILELVHPEIDENVHSAMFYLIDEELYRMLKLILDKFST